MRADRDIVAGERRITAQLVRLEQLALHGRDTTLAEQLLAQMQGNLAQWRAHRHEILRRLRRS